MKELAPLVIIILLSFGNIKKSVPAYNLKQETAKCRPQRKRQNVSKLTEIIFKERDLKMHNDEKFTEKMKDGIEKTGDMMKEGFEKAKDFVHNAAENVKEKVKDGAQKLSDIKDDVFDAVDDTGENINEQVSCGMEEPIGEEDDPECLCHIYDDVKNPEDMEDEESITITETYEEYDEIIPKDDKDAA